MSQIFFSKQDPLEKANRLSQLVDSRGYVTVWIKGKKDKITIPVFKYDKERLELVLDSKEDIFPLDSEVLCTFEVRGMSFFSQVTFKKSVGNYGLLLFDKDFFKSERRSSYRLLTFPIYEVWGEFGLDEVYQGGNVIDMRIKGSQTQLFRSFLSLVDGKVAEQEVSSLKIRIQDLSTTGMAIHVGELEAKYFDKDVIFKDVKIIFSDETILIPEVKVVYAVNYISSDKKLKKYKIGLHFSNLSSKIDDMLGKKINKLLRDIDSNKDFETFLK